jgi:hypothetical protein
LIPASIFLRKSLAKKVAASKPGNDERRGVAPKPAEKSLHFLVISGLWG